MTSIQTQTEQNFDLLLLNDHFGEVIYKKLSRYTILMDIEDGITPAEIRFRGISYGVQNKYKRIIFTDTDDYFSDNRIEASIRKLKKYDFVYNEIDLVDSDKNNLQFNYMGRIGIESEYRNISDMVDKNLFGLSNSAIASAELRDIYIPREIIAVDWWIFSILLLKGCKGGFIANAKTYYRQSDQNIVGVRTKLNAKRLQIGVKVKLIHYKNIINYCNQSKLEKEKEIYNAKLEEMIELNEGITNSPFRRKYIDVINRNYDDIFRGWWSEILPIGEWEKYAN